MKRKFVQSFCILLLCTSVVAQTDGDYRTNFVGTSASWANTSIWERYDGLSASWIPAGSFPTSLNNVITISGGDSVQITAGTSISIDQVVISSGASLIIFATPSTQTVTLDNGAGDDISVDGRFYIASGGLLTTSTSAGIRVNANGYMQLRNGGECGVDVDNYGLLEMNRFTINNGSVIHNYNLMALIDASPAAPLSIGVDNASLINSDTFLVQTTTNVFFQGVSGTNTITNDATGVLIKTGSSGTFGTVNSVVGVDFVNAGVIQGFGPYLFDQTASTFTSTGTVSPGTASSTAVMTANNAVLKSSGTVSIQIGSSNTPGTGHDQLSISSGGVTTLTGTLTITELSNAPAGVYTIMTTTGSFAGTFTTVNKPANYGPVTVSGNIVQIEKLSSTLPVTWSSFTANVISEKEVRLNWETSQESNTSHYVIEHSLDGQNFLPIGNVRAAGNSSEEVTYTFIHKTPNPGIMNYYRIRQYDQDGESSYSKISGVRFISKSTQAVMILGNPVRNSLNLRVGDTGISVAIIQINGSLLRKHNLKLGVQQIEVQDLPPGVYHLAVYESNKFLNSRSFTIAR